MKFNTIYNEDCLKTMAKMPDNFIDLVVTSPPYDNLRDYKGYTFDFGSTAKALYGILKPGGVVVWVVGDQRKNFNKTLTSFKQALFFQEIGFKVPDIMIYEKDSGMPQKNWYTPIYEFMIILVKGDKPKTINVSQVKSAWAGTVYGGGRRDADGSFKKRQRKPVPEYINKSNIWKYATGKNKTTKDDFAFKHPAMFPEQLASDHIKSWSNEGDIVYDPFMGSGTTAKMAMLLDRKYIGSEISKEYCEIAEARLKPLKDQVRLM